MVQEIKLTSLLDILSYSGFDQIREDLERDSGSMKARSLSFHTTEHCIITSYSGDIDGREIAIECQSKHNGLGDVKPQIFDMYILLLNVALSNITRTEFSCFGVKTVWY